MSEEKDAREKQRGYLNVRCALRGRKLMSLPVRNPRFVVREMIKSRKPYRYKSIRSWQFSLNFNNSRCRGKLRGKHGRFAAQGVHYSRTGRTALSLFAR
jgi:hypothetical protein